jgi:uncharacterized surface protein with fasciclin (FAS1) repeats
MEEVKQSLMKTASPLAIAIGLATGSGATLAQQQQPGANPSPAQPSAIEQRAEPAQPERNQPGVSQPQPGNQPRPGQPQAGSNQPQPGQPQVGNQPAQGNQPRQGNEAQVADQSREAGQMSSIDDLAAENSDLSQFVDAVKAAGLEDALTGGTEYTVFAPTNSALDGADIDSLMEPANRADLVALLRAHIVADDVDEQLAGQIGEAQTIDGGSIDISAEDGKIMVGGKEATEADGFEGGNLRVYAVDEVLSKGRPGQESQASLRQGGDQRSVADQAESEADRRSPN